MRDANLVAPPTGRCLKHPHAYPTGMGTSAAMPLSALSRGMCWFLLQCCVISEACVVFHPHELQPEDTTFLTDGGAAGVGDLECCRPQG